MINTQIEDGWGTGKSLRITQDGNIGVELHPFPPQNERTNVLPFRQYFTTDGAASGSNVMAVNGSVTEQLFYIQAVQDFDIYIKYLSAEISDGGSPNLNSFGALPALANGVQWVWATTEQGEYELHEGIKTNKEFVARVGNDTAAIGTGIDSFLADVSGGASAKSYFPSIDITELYGMPWGLKLRKGTTDKIIFKVRDNLTGLTTFNIVGFGIRI